MKSATLPSLRVDPLLREAAEEVLFDGETLSSFIEQSVRAQVERRKTQDAFIQRGLAARDAAKADGHYVSATDVLAGLEARLAKSKRGTA